MNHRVAERGIADTDSTDRISLVPTVVRASAGTGKTYQLTGRLMYILFRGAPVETILATTFTRKAAGEILDRVLTSLARAADPDNDKALRDLRQQVAIDSLSRLDCLHQLHRVLRNVHRLRICTMDSLFSQLARSFPLELGLPPAWRLTDEIEELWIQEAAAESMISSLDPGEMTSLLSMLGKGEQKRSITREVLRVVQRGYTIQRQCPQDVWHRISVPKAPDASKLIRIADQMRRVELPQKSLVKKLSTIADFVDTKELRRLVADTLLINIAKARRTMDSVKYGRSKFPDGELDDAFDTLYAAVRTEALSLLSAQNRATGHILSAYDHHVTAVKQNARTLGFDDVAARLASQFAGIDAAVLGGRMDGAIDHLLLDEFQDTSPIQWQVLRPLAMRTAGQSNEADDPSTDGRTRSFYCVGDTKQAIYGWRGGVAEIFDTVEQQIDGVRVDGLHESYRSSPVILEVINGVFGNLTRHPMAAVKDAKDVSDSAVFQSEALSRFTKNFKEHVSKRNDLPGYVSFRTCRGGEGDSESRKIRCYEDAAGFIAELNSEAPGRSIGVLMRSNSGVANMFFQLERLGIDVSQEGGNPLTDSAAVRVVLSALMWAEHPGDRRWEFHVRSTPLYDRLANVGVRSELAASGETRVGVLSELAASGETKVGVLSELAASGETRVGVLSELAANDSFVPNGADVIRRMTEERGLTETVEFLAGTLSDRCDRQETIRLRQLTYLAMSYQQNQTSTRLRDFVRLVKQKRVERPQIAPVRVMTIHQAKGLEFDAVVLPELSGDLTRIQDAYVADTPVLGDPPVGISRWMDNKTRHFLSKHWQREFGKKIRALNTEALCTLYVAMTRARQALYMLMEPSTKAEFANKTAASLIYHALRIQQDATESDSLLFQTGDPNWHQSPGGPASDRRSRDEPPAVEIRFKPTPTVPRRNRSNRSDAALSAASRE